MILQFRAEREKRLPFSSSADYGERRKVETSKGESTVDELILIPDSHRELIIHSVISNA